MFCQSSYFVIGSGWGIKSYLFSQIFSLVMSILFSGLEQISSDITQLSWLIVDSFVRMVTDHKERRSKIFELYYIENSS